MSEEKTEIRPEKVDAPGLEGAQQLQNLIIGFKKDEEGPVERVFRRVGELNTASFKREAGRVVLTLAAVVVGALIQGIGG